MASDEARGPGPISPANVVRAFRRMSVDEKRELVSALVGEMEPAEEVGTQRGEGLSRGVAGTHRGARARDEMETRERESARPREGGSGTNREERGSWFSQHGHDPAVPLYIRETPKLSVFSGTNRDCSYARWSFEVRCLESEGVFATGTVLAAVRKSLRSPAAETIIHLDSNAGLDQVMRKLQSLYGTTISGDTLLEKFFSEPQEDGESCASFCTRLEECVYAASEKGAVSVDAIPQMLRSRFWAGLVNPDVKNALRPKRTHLDLEQLVEEARALTEEFRPRGGQAGKNKGWKRVEVKTHITDEQQVINKKIMDDLGKLQALTAKLAASMEEIRRPGAAGGAAERSTGPAVCSACNQSGHIAIGCRKGSTLSCYRCAQAGHISRGCRQMPRQVPLNGQGPR